MATGNITKEYISSVEFLDKREILNRALDVANEEASFLDIMEMTRRSVVTSQPEYHHYINENLFMLGVVASVSGTGTSITVNLTSATSDAARVGNVVMFNDGKQGWVSAKSGVALTVKSVDNTSINGSVSTGDNLSFFTTAFGEGSGPAQPERFTLTKKSNQVQIYKAKFTITDIQKVSTVEVEYNGKPYIMYKGQHDVLRKLRYEIGLSMMFSKKSAANFTSSNPTIQDASDNANPVQMTSGLDEQITNDGIVQALNGTTLALGDLQTLDLALRVIRAPKSYEIYVGGVMQQQFDNYMNSLGNDGMLSQAARYNISKSLNLGVDSFRLYGRDYHKIEMPMLDHAQTVNYTGAPGYAKSAYLVPMGKIKVDDGGGSVDYLRVRYMSGDGTNLRYKEVVTGALAPRPTNEEMLLNVSTSTNQGLEALGTRFFAKLTQAASS